MKLNNKQMLSEVKKYYEDFNGNLEESLFNWIIKRLEKADQYETALKEIKKENGTPYAQIAEEALID